MCTSRMKRPRKDSTMHEITVCVTLHGTGWAPVSFPSQNVLKHYDSTVTCHMSGHRLLLRKPRSPAKVLRPGVSRMQGPPEGITAAKLSRKHLTYCSPHTSKGQSNVCCTELQKVSRLALLSPCLAAVSLRDTGIILIGDIGTNNGESTGRENGE